MIFGELCEVEILTSNILSAQFLHNPWLEFDETLTVGLISTMLSCAYRNPVLFDDFWQRYGILKFLP